MIEFCLDPRELCASVLYPGIDGKLEEVDRLVYREAKSCPDDLKMQTAMVFLPDFLPDTLCSQVCLHWPNQEPEEWMCQIL